ncbi:hypothetical protein N7451_010715 [Penicillium sp. IBT 35674x]|nr:hypothetical protein N7451_010715 [Penicillium sp. IBT 35674x]
MPNLGLTSTFLLVIAIALQYTGKYRSQILETKNVDATFLKDKILSTVRSRLLDIVSVGSLEAVQTCVLLGTYYLYHGSPNLAWPVCGCGLRVAQAMNLHRKLPINQPISAQVQRNIETRKRCWWAIYEIETFCSISYGYPHGIVDADCNVELLDPLMTSPGQSPAIYDELHQCPASLLSYKYLMSKLSVLLKDVLNDLYGVGSHQSGSSKRRPGSLGLKRLLHKVPILDDRLQKWKAELPDILRLNPSTPTRYSCGEEMDCDIGASGPGFESHIYQLQALALSLAYENARILIHRPLLAYRTRPGGNRELRSLPNPSRKASHLSLEACRDAAMNTSHLGESLIFTLAADTYAAAFISIHTFTAGVMLCVLTNIDPLAPESQQSKIGLRRLLKMQAHLKSKSRSPLSDQGLDILERLTRLVMEKELKEILTPSNEFSSQFVGNEPRRNGDIQNLGESEPNIQLDETEEATQEEGLADFVEDTTVSQALFELDQVLSCHDYDMALEPFSPDIAPSNGLAQEQAWIWGMENSMQSFWQL